MALVNKNVRNLSENRHEKQLKMFLAFQSACFSYQACLAEPLNLAFPRTAVVVTPRFIPALHFLALALQVVS